MRVLELHAPMRPIKRSEGRSSVQMSAYISRTCMEDERTGETHDARRKGGAEFTGIVAEENAPEWAFDQRKLWNSVELSSKRKDAQVAREIEISLPHEFSPEQRREAALKIAHMLIRRYGGAAQYALHEPGKEGDCRNFHGHFLFTTRRFDQNGGWAKKDSPLDDIKKGPKEVESLRAEIAAIQNDIAVREQHQIFVEHLSFQKRGLDKQPTQHMGKNATAIERRGEVTDIGTKNREIVAENQERAATREEIKVIHIDLAREQLQQKQQRSPAPPRTQDEEHASLYRESYDRRTAMVEAFERAHGQQEKELQKEAARLTGDIENAGFLKGIWRRVTGRTRQDREALENVSAKLSEIARLRDEQRAAFERDRLVRLEALKEQHQARELEQEAARPLARAVGDVPAAQARPQAAQTAPAIQQAPSSLPRVTDADAKRRAYFQRVGAQRKAERQAEEPKTPTKAFEEARKPKAPEPARDFDQAASGIEQTPATPAELGAAPTTDYAARKAAYMRRMRRRQERDDGLTRDR